MQFDRIFSNRREKVDLNLWVDLYYDAVWSFCRRRIGPELASDATQETFATAWKKMNAYRSEVAPKTWLFGIAIRHCANLQRKNRLESSLDEILGSGAEGLESQVIRSQQLTCALKSLTPEHREVVMLHEMDGLTYEEISQTLNIPIGTVKSRLHHAFQKLRAELFEEEAR